MTGVGSSSHVAALQKHVMAWQQCWLVLAAGVLSALVTSASGRTANDDGICNSVTQYVAGEGKRALDGTTLTYCAGERDCHRTPVQFCCNGWRRDPDSKKLRCIKIDPADSAGIDALGVAADLGSAKDSTSVRMVWNAMERDAGAHKNVRRPRDSPSASGNSSAERSNVTEQSGVSGGPNAQASIATISDQSPSQNGSTTVATANRSVEVAGRNDSHSVQNPDQAPQKISTNLATVGDRKPENGSIQSNKAHPPVVAAPDNGKQTVGSPSSVPVSAGSATDASHNSTKVDDPSPKSSVAGSSTAQVSTKSGSASASGPPAGNSSQPDVPPSVQDPPVAIQPDPKNNASTHSAIGHSAVGSQTPAKEDSIGQHRDTKQMKDPKEPSNPSGTEASTAATSQDPQPPVPITADVVESQVNQSTSVAAHTETTATPVVTTPNKSGGSISPSGQRSNATTAVVSQPVLSDQNASSTNQSRQDTSALTLTSPELEHGRKVFTVNNTNASLPATSNANTTGAGESHPQVVNGTNRTQNETSNNSVHKGLPDSPHTATTGTAVPTQNISHGDTIATNTTNVTSAASAANTTKVTSAANTTNVNGSTTPAIVANTTNLHGSNTSACAANATNIHGGSTSAGTGNETHVQAGTAAAGPTNATNVPASQQPNVHAGNNTFKYNATDGTSSGNGSAAQGAAKGNSTVVTGQPGGASAANGAGKNDTAANGAGKNDTAANGAGKNDTAANGAGKNDTASPTDIAKTSTALPVVHSLGENPRDGTAVPSTSSASKTASEVTISLLLVAAVAFVAALLYWRSRRRRRRYINCGTREPNHFSNPVYDLEAMMEQTSLVKLQNAADIEDGDLDD